MVKHYGEKKVIEVVAKTCDRCQKRYDDVMELQEFMSWGDTCGYGNVTYGDMSRIDIDLCQYCVKQALGQWIRVRDENGFDVEKAIANSQYGQVDDE